MSTLFRRTAACTCTTSPSTLLRASPVVAPIRNLHAVASAPTKGRVPAPREPITTPAALLAASGRKLSQYESKLGDWNELFTKTSDNLKDLGMLPKERRYLLWVLERYRQGENIKEVALPPLKKKIVQLGKRVR
ncbi:hypothetical protein MNV49_005010 [Pseudohyphozyma bogoriensis]|nr:hypothetical protein MNV49_005010 [Pseudohyphozyma bogoriensis]